METTMLSRAQLDTIESNTDALSLEYGDVDAAVVESALPHVLAGIDDDIEQDLRAIGVELRPNIEREMADAQREATAALLLRRASAIADELATVQATMTLEIEAIRQHYERRMAPLRHRYGDVIGFVQILAEVTEWKRKKSHETPYGIYGVTDRSATVKCEDRDKVTAWAVESAPNLVTVATTISLAEAREHFTEAEIEAKCTLDVKWNDLKKTLDPDGELPDGVAKVPAAREPYAKPAILAR